MKSLWRVRERGVGRDMGDGEGEAEEGLVKGQSQGRKLKWVLVCVLVQLVPCAPQVGAAPPLQQSQCRR